MTEHRIVSLIASATEIVCALGFEDQLVGRSHECDYPPAVKALPQCTSPKFDVEGSSRQIDQRVKTLVEDALSVYRVDAGMLETLHPTHIITQSQCEVCAVSLKDVERAVCELTSSRPRIVSLEPNALGDVWTDIQRVGDALDASDQAEKLIDKLQSRMDEVGQRTHWLATNPTVACIEWIDPLMAAGNWMPELVAMAGGVNLFGETGMHSPWITWDELVKRDPEILFVSPCGFGVARTLQEMELLASKPEWREINAVRSNRVFVADGNQYFHRPGPRLAESLEILAEMIHPNVFHFGYEDRGWVRYSQTFSNTKAQRHQ
ncbi:MAG TPA: cobalamin-binding protein [Blastocatellia bacterium]|nr:cobalamin-binding protein [Blastocatellia bacterium]